jgi:hypothetical protein
VIALSAITICDIVYLNVHERAAELAVLGGRLSTPQLLAAG